MPSANPSVTSGALKNTSASSKASLPCVLLTDVEDDPHFGRLLTRGAPWIGMRLASLIPRLMLMVLLMLMSIAYCTVQYEYRNPDEARVKRAGGGGAADYSTVRVQYLVRV